MHTIKNIPTLLLWFGTLLWAVLLPETLFGAAAALVLAGPWLYRFSRKTKANPQMSTGLARYATCQSMTVMSLTKASMAHGTVPPKWGAVTDRS
jgi:hypothetical protein